MKSKIKLILLCGLCLLLSIVCVTQTIAWVQTNDSVAIDSGDIISASRGVTGGFESDLNKTQYLIGGTTGTVRQGYIPGDRKYYTFVINVLYSTLQQAAGKNLQLGVSLELDASASATASASTGSYSTFLSHLTVEENQVELAVLHRSRQGTSYEYTVRPINGNLHINNATSPASLTSSAQNSFWLAEDSEPNVYVIVTVSGMDWTGSVISDNVWTDETGAQMVSFMVFMPIWYRDTEASQDVEKDCVLAISGCNVIASAEN